MPKSLKPSLVAAAFFIVIGSVAIAYGAYRTFTTRGDQAIASMNESERSLLIKISQIRKGMTYAEVTAILGEPDRASLGFRPTWRVNNSPFNQIAVYIGSEGVFKVRWLSLGRFVYEPSL